MATHEFNNMIIPKSHYPATDIHPATSQDAPPCPSTRISERPLYPSSSSSSSTHLLAIPTEIRLQIYYHYFLALDIPDRHFTYSSMLSYWSDASGVICGYETRASRPGRRTPNAPLLSLLLVNHQVRLEAEELLYRAFVICIPPHLSSPTALHALLSSSSAPSPGLGAQHPISRLRHIQLNLSLKSRFWHTPPRSVFRRWRAALQVLATALPQLRTVGLAVHCVPSWEGTPGSWTTEDLLGLLCSFVRVLVPAAAVRVRFVDLDLDLDLGRGELRASVPLPWGAELQEEDRLLLRLRDEDRFTWHGVAMHFQDPSSELYSVTGLQARYVRLKMRVMMAKLEAECLAWLEGEFKSSFA